MTTRRIPIIFIFLMVLFTGLIARLYVLGVAQTPAISVQSAEQREYILTVAQRRGHIYDRNFQRLVNDVETYHAIVDPNSVIKDNEKLSEILKDFTDLEPDEIDSKIKAERPFVLELKGLPDYNPSMRVFRTCRRNSDNQLAPHILGSVNIDGEGVSGIERALNDYLKDNSGSIKAVIEVDAFRRSISGIGAQIDATEYQSQSGVVLSLDKDIQAIAEEAADMRSGAVLVCDALTGDILASVSRPNYNVNASGNYLNFDESPLINRVFNSYNLGSIFKIAVAAAALENDVPLEKYICSGKIQFGDVTINCFNRSGHGELTFEEAFAKSCNTYFINLAQEIGSTILRETASNLGFGKSLEIAPGMFSSSGSLPSLTALLPPASLANLAIGQGTLLVTPLQVAQMLCVITSDGYNNSPSLIKGFLDYDGNYIPTLSVPERNQVIKSDTAAKLREMLIYAVEEGTGKSAIPESGGAGGKTASAETGLKKDGRSVVQTWFTGFYPAENPKYVIVVLTEDGDSGGISAAPIFKKIADALYLFNSPELW